MQNSMLKQTRNILNNIVEALTSNIDMRFVWAETVFLDLWWNESNQKKKDAFKELIQSG